MKPMIISPPEEVTNEAAYVNTLFSAGLGIYHLRKPLYSQNNLEQFIDHIDKKYTARIVLHTHHDIAKNMGITRLHFTERNRLNTTHEEIKAWHDQAFTLSTSIHTIDDYRTLPGYFLYTFFGPVFESISKEGYKPASTAPVILPQKEDRVVKIIAIGGISADKIEKVKKAGFDGAAMLGAVWRDPDKALDVFKDACNA